MNQHGGRMGRRDALKILGQGAAAGAVVLTGAKRAWAEACDAEIDAKSKQMRKALQYVEKTKKPGQACETCLQYVKPGKGEKCGGCKLFTGPVAPEGYCLSYAPMKK